MSAPGALWEMAVSSAAREVTLIAFADVTSVDTHAVSKRSRGNFCISLWRDERAAKLQNTRMGRGRNGHLPRTAGSRPFNPQSAIPTFNGFSFLMPIFDCLLNCLHHGTDPGRT